MSLLQEKVEVYGFNLGETLVHDYTSYRVLVNYAYGARQGRWHSELSCSALPLALYGILGVGITPSPLLYRRFNTIVDRYTYITISS